MTDITQLITDAYFSKNIGLPTAKNIHAYLNKKATLKQIQEVLTQIKGRRNNTKIKPNSQRIMIPIMAPASSFQMDL